MPSKATNSAYYIGLMSGTSMDGIDAVLVDLSKAQAELICSHSHPFPASLQTQLSDIISPAWKGSLLQIGRLHQKLGKLFADSVSALLQKKDISAQNILAIGSHGQTVWHQPEGDHPFSIQLGDASQISELTGITTVADFRSRDIAAGGQGAPLVPAFHQALFAKANINRILLNIGGIANITLMAGDKKISGFDTGPGNGLMDAWIKKHKQENFDKNGDWASSGTINNKLLDQLLNDQYFSLPAPKSTGKEYFNLQWLEAAISISIKPQDIQATLVELSAISIADAINSATSMQQNWHELYVCGGGIHNQFLMERLQHHLPAFKITSTQRLGVSPDWMEAIAFAWLAKQTLEGKPGNLASVTGAKGARILGAIYPR